jgi:sugar-specific transcriptional regulator TrmB
LYTKQKLITGIFVITILLNKSIVLASSSTSFQTNDENLSFGHNEGYMESSSYALDLSSVTWTERYGESSTFTLIDANSDLDPSVTPPTPPDGGDDGGGGSGGSTPPLVYMDIPKIETVATEDERDLNKAETEETEEQQKQEEIVIDEQEKPDFLRPSPVEIKEIEEITEKDEKIFIFTEKEPILYYKSQRDYDNYDFYQIEDYNIEPLKLNVSDYIYQDENNKLKITGKTGHNYEIISLWIDNGSVITNKAVSNNEGDFIIDVPDELEEDKYFVFVYGLKIDGQKIVQTNYQSFTYVKSFSQQVKKTDNHFDLFAICIIIALTGFYSLWRKNK